MHSIPIPDQSYEEIFRLCIPADTDVRKTRFDLSLPKLLASVGSYKSNMHLTSGHMIKRYVDGDFTPITEDELKWLYDGRLVPNGVPGRRHYDKLLVRSKMKSCCFCSYEEPVELDHFLPKNKFAQFAINPQNLVPVCHRCNKKKFTYAPSGSSENLIHPYFENYDDLVWLSATIQFVDNTPIARFKISNDQMEDDIIARLNMQFKKLELFDRYTIQCSREIASRHYKFTKTYNDRGISGLKEDLTDEALSKELIHKNSWEAALYRALCINDHFQSMTWEL